ncbi:hypothetical protein [Desulfobacter vibrioformis]|uniref:hypothetical protein n=1 Tax=Desulfobacter vibrioformis TaxID=34031 RepID=UPI000555BB74|nr:hypothetical protein [Desulfobacter vibrioformis]
MGDKFYLCYEDGSNTLELPQIRNPLEDVTAGLVGVNERRTDVVETMKEGEKQLKSLVRMGVKPILLMVYRSVAVGGVVRRLGSFVAKPLTYKAKSIDPQILTKDNGTDRLSGLLPTDNVLGKGNKPGEVTPAKKMFYRRESEHVSSDKWELRYEIQSPSGIPILSWEKLGSTSSKKLVALCADKMGRPYVADWDLVTVAVYGGGFLSQMKERDTGNLLKVENDGGATGILPTWLKNAINAREAATNGATVTRHGPESLYCGNNIMDANMCLISNLTGLGGTQPVGAEKVQEWDDHCMYSATPGQFLEWMKNDPSKIWTFYSFDQFDGTVRNLSEKDKTDQIKELNKIF